MNKPKKKDGRFSYDGLDRVFHEKARLGILTSLLANPEGLLFNDLKSLCSLTDGNLSRHISTLTDAGLVQIWKGYNGKKPQTLCKISPNGKEKYLDYLKELENVVRDAAAAKSMSKPVSEAGQIEGFSPA